MQLPSSLSPVSLTGRLTLLYALAFMVFLSASFLLLFWAIGTVLDKRMDEDLQEDIAEFSELLSIVGPDGLVEEMEKETLAGEHQHVFLMLYQSDGTLMHSTNLERWVGLEPDQRLIDHHFQRRSEPSLQSLALVSQEAETRVVYDALSPEYVLIIGESTNEKDEIMRLLAIALALVFLFTLPLASLIVWLLTRRAIVGIQSISNAAKALSSGDLDRRVHARNQVTEVQTLADTFDAMAERIQTLIRNMREMTDNIAHDLRSPIGRVRLLSESTLHSPLSATEYRKNAEDTIAECDRLISLINTSLDVAETEAGVTYGNRAPVDMKALTADACELFEAVAEDKNIRLESHLSRTTPIQGDINSLQRMVANLIDNAIKYSRSGGTIRVSLEVVDACLELKLKDNGIGINEADIGSIFNRFYRAEPSRTDTGCGLGLSYARAVARLHGGDILVRSKIFDYTEFTIILPFASAGLGSSQLSLAT